jgi:acyl carrier protein
VVEQTKYPRESINSAARLLDDLNLDSIKSAELVAQTAKQLGIEGQIDPSNFANATIAEVVEALQELIQSSKHQQQSPLAASTNHVNSRNPGCVISLLNM